MWGFRLKGGKDFGVAPTIARVSHSKTQKLLLQLWCDFRLLQILDATGVSSVKNVQLLKFQVTPGGKAEHKGLQENDQILYINDVNCDNLSHMDCQESIKRAGTTLRLGVYR